MSGPGGGSAPLSLPRPPIHPLDAHSTSTHSSLHLQVDELEAKAASMRTVLSQLVDADKDVDTEDRVGEGGGGGVDGLGPSTTASSSTTTTCESPPPLPSLIFDAQLANVPGGLLGSDPLLAQHPFHRSATKFQRSSSPHPMANNLALSGVILNDNFPDLSNDNNANSTCASSTTNLFNDFIDNQDLADFNSNTDYGGGDLRYSSPHTSRPISRASSQTSLSSSTAASITHLPRRSQSTHTPTRGLRRPLRQTRSASRCNRSQVFTGFNLPGCLSTSSVNLDSQEDVANLILTLRKERSRLLQEIEAEEEERAWFYSQLENINQQLRRLSTTDNLHDVSGPEKSRSRSFPVFWVRCLGLEGVPATKHEKGALRRGARREKSLTQPSVLRWGGVGGVAGWMDVVVVVLREGDVNETRLEKCRVSHTGYLSSAAGWPLPGGRRGRAWLAEPFLLVGRSLAWLCWTVGEQEAPVGEKEKEVGLCRREGPAPIPASHTGSDSGGLAWAGA
ncbi:uncharacterized protein LOC122251157 [Penaeus japonicus]|uniref:uncharacterized protein LOC122251157 n=1 Tax=Penaeus japonicus TaxID=27405 RepID=UPI001C70F828|nr:uncharacterized protein LOC122251157 [Penaeus japonicus]